MRRAALVIVLALLAFDVTGLSSLCGELGCDEPCPTDVDGGGCPPNCHSCSCCSLPRVTATTPDTFVAPQARDTSWVSATADLIAPEPADILHVPKPALA